MCPRGEDDPAIVPAGRGGAKRFRAAPYGQPHQHALPATATAEAWTRSAPSMPPGRLRVCHRLVMRALQEHPVQALHPHPEFTGGPRRQHVQSIPQGVPGPPLTAARARELGLPLPPSALGAVDAHGPHAQRHRHDARRQSLPFEHTDGGVRRSGQTRDIAVPHPRTSPTAFPRPEGRRCPTRHGPSQARHGWRPSPARERREDPSAVGRGNRLRERPRHRAPDRFPSPRTPRRPPRTRHLHGPPRER